MHAAFLQAEQRGRAGRWYFYNRPENSQASLLLAHIGILLGLQVERRAPFSPSPGLYSGRRRRGFVNKTASEGCGLRSRVRAVMWFFYLSGTHAVPGVIKDSRNMFASGWALINHSTTASSARYDTNATELLGGRAELKD